MQAFADVIKSPEEAADITINANPEYASKKDVLVKQIQADVKYTFFNDETKTKGIGWMNSDTWQKTVKLLVDQGAMKGNIDATKAFTDKYVAASNPLKH
jgi:NitT/TauT family transport system substrate-binding protein